MKTRTLLALLSLVMPTAAALAQTRSPHPQVTVQGWTGTEWKTTRVDADGNTVIVGDESSTPLSAFGELLTVNPIPKIQIDAVYGIRASVVGTDTINGATATASDGLFRVSSGTNAAGEAMLYSRRRNVYHPGQGEDFKATAMFTTGVADSTQMIAAGNVEDGFGFGYNGVEFGVFHRKGGKREIQTLTIGTVSGGAETATVTIDGVADTCPITASTVQTNASEIVSGCSWTGWTLRQVDDAVIFIADAAADKTGSFTYATDGSGVGSFAETRAGVTATDEWTNQADWSKGALSYTLDPTNLNVYQFSIGYLGAASITYRIMNPTSGRFETVHIDSYPNQHTTPNLGNPNLSLCIFATNAGSTTSVSVYSASMAGFTQGESNGGNPPDSHDTTLAVGTTETPILSMRVGTTFAGVVNKQEAHPHFVTFTNGGSKAAVFRMYSNTTLTGTTNWQAHSATSFLEYDESATGVSGGQRVGTIGVSSGRELLVPMSDLGMNLGPGDVVTFTARQLAGGSSGDMIAAMTWVED